MYFLFNFILFWEERCSKLVDGQFSVLINNFLSLFVIIPRNWSYDKLKVLKCYQSFCFVQSNVVLHLSSLSLNADRSLQWNCLKFWNFWNEILCFCLKVNSRVIHNSCFKKIFALKARFTINMNLLKGCLTIINLEASLSDSICLSFECLMCGATCLACWFGWL